MDHSVSIRIFYFIFRVKYERKCERVIVLDACYTIKRPTTICLEKKKKSAHLSHILFQLSFALVVWLTTPQNVIKSIAFSFFKSSLEDSGQQSKK